MVRKSKKTKSRGKPKTRPPRSFNLKEFLRQNRWPFILVGVGILLRFVDLGRQGLWIDEMCCWIDARSSYKRIFNTVHDVVFLLEKISLSLGGEHEYFLRLPSAFGGLLAVGFIYPLTSVLFQNRRISLLALVLMVFSPINIYYSQDANYYGLMMGLTTASLFFLFLFIRGHNPLWLVVYGLVSYANYHVHPASVLLMGCQISALGIFLVTDRAFHRSVVAVFRKVSEKKPVLWGGVAILAAVLGFFGFRFLGFIRSMSFQATGTLVPENLSLNPEFFKLLAMDYGLAFQQYIPYVFVLTLIFLVFFFRGLVFSFRKNRYFALFVLFSWTLPFIAIYIKKVGHFYHCRYTSFIVPGYLILAACGIERIGEFFRKRGGKRAARVALSVCMAVVALGMGPNLFRYYTGHKQDWKGAVKYLRKHRKPGDVVTSHLFCNDSSLRFYYDYFKDMDTDSLIKLSGEFRGSPYSSLFRLKKLSFLKPGTYYATSYTRYENRDLWEWVKKYFDTVFDEPSLHPEEINREGKEVLVYKFRHSGSFVFPPYPYYFTPDSPVFVDRGFEKDLLFGDDGNYRMKFDLSAESDEEYIIRAATGTGDPVSRKVPSRNGSVTTLLELKEGVYTVSIEPAGAGKDQTRLKKLSIFPEVKGAYRREAEDTDLYHPTPWKRIEKRAGSMCFTLERNNYVYYDKVPFEDGGRFGFTLRALEDKPGPVMIDVALDWNSIGLLVFPKGDDSWSEKSFSFEAPPGDHTISLHFLASPVEVAKLVGGKMPADRSKDTDASLDYFEVKSLSPDDEFPDERIRTKGALVAASQRIVEGFRSPGSGDKLAPGWDVNSPSNCPHDFPGTGERPEAVRFTIPPDAKGLFFLTPPFRVRPQALLYFSAWLKVENLKNHTANMQVAYLGGGKAVRMDIVNADGITKDTDWVRQLYFRPCPPGATHARIILWVYPNSRRFSTEKGYVWFDRVRFENPEKQAPGTEKK